MTGAAAVIDYLYDTWRMRRLIVGPVLITTVGRSTEDKQLAFSYGREHGAAFGPNPPAKRERHLRAIS